MTCRKHITPSINRTWRKLGPGATWTCHYCGAQFLLRHHGYSEFWDWEETKVAQPPIIVNPAPPSGRGGASPHPTRDYIEKARVDGQIIVEQAAEIKALLAHSINQAKSLPGLKWPNPLASEVDHGVPWAAGGGNDLENLQVAHQICNKVKSDDVEGWLAFRANRTRTRVLELLEEL